uniref:glutathione gamma-glutamylcysteinyltransferase n=1 Tax=Chromera velia CCMP2878 TaxID=1169474 RepID=A0A0G4H6G5_9ALVE|eukprot:Cvel_5764.t1-p1 / transcript=Cvel_5764.t1 / gene=Cvel_5764 / organism=Chromera_velia_CCMP2878 / gene_product=hypothetical protein / transcript_product=hypothetical protein / location=Cvel_scaffold274:9696-12985(-) / protein_length=422 / sequence_SO=supercontig / SO=protein_coding / is_pseudo=false
MFLLIIVSVLCTLVFTRAGKLIRSPSTERQKEETGKQKDPHVQATSPPRECVFNCALPPTLVHFASKKGRELLHSALYRYRDPELWPEVQAFRNYTTDSSTGKSEDSFSECIEAVVHRKQTQVFGLDLPSSLRLSEIGQVVGITLPQASSILECQCRKLFLSGTRKRREIDQRDQTCDLRTVSWGERMAMLSLEETAREGGRETEAEEWRQMRTKLETVVSLVKERDWERVMRDKHAPTVLEIAEKFALLRKEEFKEFVTDLLEAMDNPWEKGFFFVNYSRILEMIGVGGHFSPVGAVVADSEGKRWALIFDVARYKFDLHWAPLELLFLAVSERGYGMVRRCRVGRGSSKKRPFFFLLTDDSDSAAVRDTSESTAGEAFRGLRGTSWASESVLTGTTGVTAFESDFVRGGNFPECFSGGYW